MPMSNDAKFEKVQRLLTAHGRTKKTLEKEPVVWELHPGTDIAQNWPVITAGVQRARADDQVSHRRGEGADRPGAV